MSSSAPETIVDVFADGACRGNPGPGGWGASLQIDGQQKDLCGGEDHTTNNRMELTAVIEALSALKRHSTVRVHTDSKYVQQGISTWIHNWKKNGWRTSDKKPVKNDDLWKRLDAVASQHRIEWIWVKGHAGHPGNELADTLANRGIDELKQRK